MLIPWCEFLAGDGKYFDLSCWISWICNNYSSFARILFVDIFLTTGTGCMFMCIGSAECMNHLSVYDRIMAACHAGLGNVSRTLLNSYGRFSFWTSLTFMLQFDIEQMKKKTKSFLTILFKAMFILCTQSVKWCFLNSIPYSASIFRPFHKSPIHTQVCTIISLRACRVYWFMYHVPAWNSRFNSLDRDW